MTLYDLTVPYFDKCLKNLDAWIDKTHAFATAKKFEPDTLLSARLAPDAHPLVRQVQSVCDQAKFACARVTAKTPPAHPDTEKTWAELRTRIHAARELVNGFKPADFEGAETRAVALPWMPGKVILGKAYIQELMLPNFDFHYTMTYAILRHNGVDLGKQDFIGALTLQDA